MKKKLIIGLAALGLAVVATIVILKVVLPSYDVEISGGKSVRNSLKVEGAKVVKAETVDGVKTIEAEMETECGLAEEDNVLSCDDVKIEGSFKSNRDVELTISENADEVEISDNKLSFVSEEIVVEPMKVTEVKPHDDEKRVYTISMTDKDSGKTILEYELTLTTKFSEADNKYLTDNAAALKFQGKGEWVSEPFQMNAGLYVVKYSVHDSTQWGGGHIEFSPINGDMGLNYVDLHNVVNGVSEGVSSVSIPESEAGKYRITLKSGGYSDSAIGDWTIEITQ